MARGNSLKLSLSKTGTIPCVPSLLRKCTAPNSPLIPCQPFGAPLQTSNLKLTNPIKPQSVLQSKTRKTPPPPPSAWLWRCHLCLTVYRLSATRRCLNDGHIFCSLPPASVPSRNPVQAPEKAKPKRKRRQLMSCASEFDYDGWETWNSWRSEVCLAENPSGEMGRGNTPRRQRNCYQRCEFPSQCLHIGASGSESEAESGPATPTCEEADWLQPACSKTKEGGDLEDEWELDLARMLVELKEGAGSNVELEAVVVEVENVV